LEQKEILFLYFSFFYLQKQKPSVKIKPVEKKRQGGAIMAKCAICEKGAHFGNNVSHSHRRSNKMWKSNVKSVKVKTGATSAKKMYVCTSCLRSGKVERA
jgi:large subunit ribosomal protein L28